MWVFEDGKICADLKCETHQQKQTSMKQGLSFIHETTNCPLQHPSESLAVTFLIYSTVPLACSRCQVERPHPPDLDACDENWRKQRHLRNQSPASRLSRTMTHLKGMKAHLHSSTHKLASVTKNCKGEGRSVHSLTCRCL